MRLTMIEKSGKVVNRSGNILDYRYAFIANPKDNFGFAIFSVGRLRTSVEMLTTTNVAAVLRSPKDDLMKTHETDFLRKFTGQFHDYYSQYFQRGAPISSSGYVTCDIEVVLKLPVFINLPVEKRVSLESRLKNGNPDNIVDEVFNRKAREAERGKHEFYANSDDTGLF